MLHQYIFITFSLYGPHSANSVIESPCPSVCGSVFVCHWMHFLGLSLALRSHDQFQAFHYSSPQIPPLKKNIGLTPLHQRFCGPQKKRKKKIHSPQTIFLTLSNKIFFWIVKKKSCIRETSTLSTDADSRTDTILERLCRVVGGWVTNERPGSVHVM